MHRATRVVAFTIVALAATGCVALAVGSAGSGDAAATADAVTTGRHADRTMAADVRSRLTRSTIVDTRNVAVTVRDGIVTLSGAVVSLAAREHAEKLAAGTPGVESVINNLETKP